VVEENDDHFQKEPKYVHHLVDWYLFSFCALEGMELKEFTLCV